MSAAETLRKAAALMRERAAAAIPGPWEATYDDHGRKGVDVMVWSETAGHYVTEDMRGASSANRRVTAEHIAGMDPLVALAVAVWLDMAAFYIQHGEWEPGGIYGSYALAVARAYLGEPSP